MFDTDLIEAIRDRFAHVDHCPEQGPRIFFENAGGALTLKSVVDASVRYAAIPDNQGRDNPMSHALVAAISKAKADARVVLNADAGQIFVGESGTELLFRMIMNACLGTPAGTVVGSTLEHPASRSAAKRWAKIAGKPYISVPHDDATGSVEASAYAAYVTAETRVATILHTSPVTGMSVDVAAIARAIRAVAADCLIIVDGIQHAAHGALDLDSYGIDGYAISPYKMFSRHGYGVAWISDRLAALPHDGLEGGPEDNWELGTRDTGAYATFSEVVRYLEWLGAQFTDTIDRRSRIEAAAQAIHAHEARLTDIMLHGEGNLVGLADLPNVQIIGGVDNPRREGLVSLAVDHLAAADIVGALSDQGIRTHVRKSDHYSGNVLKPLGLTAAVRVSLCHYNTRQEVRTFLAAMSEICKPD
ncbi:aminotransferase class V-fold PLP-dependent enzyme [Actibacterium sp. 188UL27-1]|uniref:aminotransferase class V-fold PLP-dependent enzyme n=1 Tax=Actibacterium sp. 188UL27-1 TaxID=2786961 RepID=UPI00195BD4F0|nr:aminotransferase class V-fold PLP-dependent enzyme [Actibacterium sp. 188UL27-1]MBM7069070.1 aminotransferase class V-fold PLP-dependent enzyme [Actibacterium sp. 188UL27-1]